MKTNMFILGFIALIAIGWVYYTHHTTPPPMPDKPIKTAQDPTLSKIPDFTYTTVEGRTGQLYDHTGTPILIHFWATWCAPCIVEFPELIKLAADNSNQLKILAISSDNEKADIKRFINSLNLPIPDNMTIIFDENKIITQDLFQTFKLPETYVLTKDMTLSEKLIGPQDDWNSAGWRDKINKLSTP